MVIGDGLMNICEEGEVGDFEPQFNVIEEIMTKTALYNTKVNGQIENLKRLIKLNQNVVERIQCEELAVERLRLEQEGNASANLIKRMDDIEEELRQTSAMFNDFRSCYHCNQRHIAQKRSPTYNQRLNELVGKLNMVGNELKTLRKDNAAAIPIYFDSRPRQRICKAPNMANPCGTPCRSMGNVIRESIMAKSRLKEMEAQQREARAMVQSLKRNLVKQRKCDLKKPIRDLDTTQLKERVKRLMSRTDNLDMKSETLRNMRIVCRKVLRTLNQTSTKQTFKINSINSTCGCGNEECDGMMCSVTIANIQQPADLSELCCNPYLCV